MEFFTRAYSKLEFSLVIKTMKVECSEVFRFLLIKLKILKGRWGGGPNSRLRVN